MDLENFMLDEVIHTQGKIINLSYSHFYVDPRSAVIFQVFVQEGQI